MAWSAAYSICDIETARKACGSAIIADTNLAMGTADITTVGAAEVIAAANNNNRTLVHVADMPMGYGCPRGFRVAYNLGGTFGSTFAVLEASLPTSANRRQMIAG